MRKGATEKRKKMSEIVATNIVASRPPNGDCLHQFWTYFKTPRNEFGTISVPKHYQDDYFILEIITNYSYSRPLPPTSTLMSYINDPFPYNEANAGKSKLFYQIKYIFVIFLGK